MDWLNSSVCEYNVPMFFVGLALMAIFWYTAHCVKCWRHTRKLYREALHKIDGLTYARPRSKISLFKK